MENDKLLKFKNIFRALDSKWLLRHYLFVGLAFIFTISVGSSTTSGTIFLLISAIFYPFAMFIYESIYNFLIGNNVFLLPIKFMIIWKFIRFILVWFFAIPIGIIGMIYLYFKVNKVN